MSRLWSAVTCAALLSLTVATQAADLTASGKVLGTDGKPLTGVTISLAQAKMSATTDASGAWDLGSTPAGIASRVAVPVANGRLILEDGRLSVRFEGRDASGRGMARTVAVSRPLARAAGEAGIPDTLLYTWKGKVRLRDTISASQTGIVRTLDTTLNPSIVHGYLTDERDGQTYRTVKIGPQVWTAQNLNFKVDSSFCYKNDTANCTQYGRLYKWAAAMGLNDSCNTKSCTSQVAAKRRGACPSGWHVPSDAEWTRLTHGTLGRADEGTKLKANNILWVTNTGIDMYGFTALPGGYRGSGLFQLLSCGAYFWSASEGSSRNAWNRDFPHRSEGVLTFVFDKSDGCSIRCLQD
jgi:uncharacterized protein (TIGR02145 family)